MKNLPISLFIIIAFLFSCKENNSQNVSSKNSTAKVQVLSPSDFKAKVDNEGVQLIDVRTPKEFNAGRIKNAKNIDFFEADFMTKMQELDKSKPVYLYCRSGNRSGKASAMLKAVGFTQIYDLYGGIIAWSKENLETEK